MDIKRFLNEHLSDSVSDMHFCAGSKPMIRDNGIINPAGDELSKEDVINILKQVMSESQFRKLQSDTQADFGFAFSENYRFRANAYMQFMGPALALRALPSSVPTLDALGLPPVVNQMINTERGLILVTGATGSGKSTTLAAMIERINETQKKHIITIEDPVEYFHRNKRCLVNQREVGTTAKSFATALRGALREDPDIILVGEMRDLETIELAITAAETGHLVLATLHTNSAAKSLDRIISVFPSQQQYQVRNMVSESLRMVLAQDLLLKKDLSGRALAVEILLGVPAAKNLIRENKVYQLTTVMQTGRGQGMQSMKQDIERLAMSGVIDMELATEKMKAM